MNFETIEAINYINSHNKYYNYSIENKELCIENKITKEITKLPFKNLKYVEYYLYGINDYISTLKTIKFSEYETYNNNEPQGETTLYLDELQAINKQTEELGWNK